MQITCSLFDHNMDCVEVVELTLENMQSYPPRVKQYNPFTGEFFWQCVSDGVIQIPLFGDNAKDMIEIHFECGELWDGASIPWLFQCIIGDPLDSRWSTASYVHDKFCVQSKNAVVRKLGDVLFWHLLRCNPDIPRWKQISMYYGVRIGSLLNYVKPTGWGRHKQQITKAD